MLTEPNSLHHGIRQLCKPPGIAPRLPAHLSKRSDMALSSGIYTIKNVKNHNWAMLLNADDGGDVVAGSHEGGEKVGSFAVPDQQQSLTISSSGTSKDYRTRLTCCRINSTARIMPAMPLSVVHRTRRRFSALGTVIPCNGISILPKAATCTLQWITSTIVAYRIHQDIRSGPQTLLESMERLSQIPGIFIHYSCINEF